MHVVIKSELQTTSTAGCLEMMRTSLNLLHNFARRAVLSASSQTTDPKPHGECAEIRVVVIL